jgi:hypothetical protein
MIIHPVESIVVKLAFEWYVQGEELFGLLRADMARWDTLFSIERKRLLRQVLEEPGHEKTR